MNYCIIIPIYNHSDHIDTVLNVLQHYPYPILIINDGSDSVNTEQLKEKCTAFKTIFYEEHTTNQGKGAAVITGLKKAYQKGYTHAIQIDADGQHDLSQLKEMVARSQKNPEALISGVPIYDDSVPGARKWGHDFTNFWVCLETGSSEIQDVMCGFRVYPVVEVQDLIHKKGLAKRMGFDVEIMVRAYWKNIKIISVPVNVVYQKEGKSHFRPIRDNVEMTWVHVRLILRKFFVSIFFCYTKV